MSWTLVPVGSIAYDIRPGFACRPTDRPDGVRHVRPHNIGRGGGFTLEKVKCVDPSKARAHMDYVLVDGDILFNNTNSPELVGKTAYVSGLGGRPATFSNHMTRIRVRRAVASPQFVARQLHHLWSRGAYAELVTQWVSQAAIGAALLAQVEVALPGLSEQMIIVEILDQADRLRALEVQSTRLADSISSALLRKMFSVDSGQCEALEDLADIRSGITKGRRLPGEALRSVPYMRVANVQDGRLDLTSIQHLDISLGELNRFALQPGDVLLTEGGDPDKLGRGAVWRGEVSPCIHQNHIFRVRPLEAKLTPEYLSAYIGSPAGKAYFLTVAKQTTGIASINRTQLGRLQVPVPPLELQRRFSRLVLDAERLASLRVQRSRRLEELFTSLLTRAFTGQLTAGWRQAHMAELLQEMEHQAKSLATPEVAA